MALESYAVAKNKYQHDIVDISQHSENHKNRSDSEQQNNDDSTTDESAESSIYDESITQTDTSNANNNKTGNLADWQKITQSLQDLQGKVDKSMISSQLCNEESWINAYEVKFVGCENLRRGDYTEYEWKLWEDALRDGDICVKANGSGDMQAYMREEC